QVERVPIGDDVADHRVGDRLPAPAGGDVGDGLLGMVVEVQRGGGAAAGSEVSAAFDTVDPGPVVQGFVGDRPGEQQLSGLGADHGEGHRGAVGQSVEVRPTGAVGAAAGEADVHRFHGDPEIDQL